MKENNFLTDNPSNLPPEAWHKVVVLMMEKLKLKEFRITSRDIEALNKDGRFPILGTHFHRQGELTFILFDSESEARAYMKAHPKGGEI